MIELKLNPNHLDELMKKGYTLEMVYILLMIKRDGGLLVWENYVEDPNYSPKWENTFKLLDRKELISSMKITKAGQELLDFIATDVESSKLVKKKPSDDIFEKWWKAYPSSDTFDYKGKHFPGTRSLKAKKEDCKLKLHKILNEGEYTIEEMVKAIELEVHQKKEASIKSGNNKLSFQQNSMTYLNQYTYESYIELVRKGQKMEETQTFKGVDI